MPNAIFRINQPVWTSGVHINAKPDDPQVIEVPDTIQVSRKWEPLNDVAKKMLDAQFAQDAIDHPNLPKRTSYAEIPVPKPAAVTASDQIQELLQKEEAKRSIPNIKKRSSDKEV
jgi:hypothetical protein